MTSTPETDKTDRSSPLAMDVETARRMWDLPLARRTRELLGRVPGFRPSRRLGQNFLTNDAAADRLAQVAADLNPPGVVEIGGGVGALSVAMLRAMPQVRLIVYEVDARLAELLAGLLSPAASRCTVVCADFLKANPVDVGAEDGWLVAGNLPYSITTPLLERIFTGPPQWSAALVMVQREFADRLMAPPGSRTYGSLSIFARFHCREIVRVMELKPGSFWPPPEVSSVALLLRLRAQPHSFVRDPAAFFEVVRSAFAHRRKTLFRSLAMSRPLGADEAQIRAAIEAAGIDPRARPETLDIEAFARLAAALAEAARAGD